MQGNAEIRHGELNRERRKKMNVRKNQKKKRRRRKINIDNNFDCDKCLSNYNIFFFYGAAAQRVPWPPHCCWGFLITQRRTTVSRTPLEEWSARRRDLTTHNTPNRQISMPPAEFEPTISAGERPQTYSLDCAATGTGNYNVTMTIYNTLLEELTEVWLVKLLRNNHCVDFRAWYVRNYEDYSTKIKPVEMSAGYSQVNL